MRVEPLLIKIKNKNNFARWRRFIQIAKYKTTYFVTVQPHSILDILGAELEY
jgi:hypothetical protein